MIVRPLTKKELKIVAHLANGNQPKQIAYIIGTTVHSVNWSIREAKKAVGAKKDTHLVAIAFRMGWIE